MTPSMVTLPKYAGSGSLGSVDSRESDGTKEKEGSAGEQVLGSRNAKEDGRARGMVFVSEKELPPIPEQSERGSAYYEDASDEEEAREVGVARQVGIARSSSKRIEYSRKMS